MQVKCLASRAELTGTVLLQGNEVTMVQKEITFIKIFLMENRNVNKGRVTVQEACEQSEHGIKPLNKEASKS